MGIKTIDYEKSRTLKVPMEWLFFVMVNPDIRCALTADPLQLFPGKEQRTFDGKIWGIKVHLDVSGDIEPRKEGMVDILANVRLYKKAHTFARYKYKSIDSETSLVDLRFRFETSGMMMLTTLIFRQKSVDDYLQKILSRLEQASSLLAQNNPKLEELLSSAELERVNKYRTSLENKTTNGNASLGSGRLPAPDRPAGGGPPPARGACSANSRPPPVAGPPPAPAGRAQEY